MQNDLAPLPSIKPTQTLTRSQFSVLVQRQSDQVSYSLHSEREDGQTARSLQLYNQRCSAVFIQRASPRSNGSRSGREDTSGPFLHLTCPLTAWRHIELWRSSLSKLKVSSKFPGQHIGQALSVTEWRGEGTPAPEMAAFTLYHLRANLAVDTCIPFLRSFLSEICMTSTWLLTWRMGTVFSLLLLISPSLLFP